MTEQSPPDWDFFIRWTLAVMLGLSFGGVLASQTSERLFSCIECFPAVVWSAFVMGILAGFLEWAVLRTYFSRFSVWIGWTLLGYISGFLLIWLFFRVFIVQNLSPMNHLQLELLQAAAGSLLAGVLQSVFLRRFMGRLTEWGWVSLVSAAVSGCLVFFVAGGISLNEFMSGLLSILIYGGTLGLFTGAYLLTLLKKND